MLRRSSTGEAVASPHRAAWKPSGPNLWVTCIEPIAVSPEDPGGTYPVSTEPGTVHCLPPRSLARWA